MTPGQAAYEAFTDVLRAHQLKGNEREGPWAKLPLAAKFAWETAAMAGHDRIAKKEQEARKRIEAERKYGAMVSVEDVPASLRPGGHKAIEPR